jgi:hypothetical protein
VAVEVAVIVRRTCVIGTGETRDWRVAGERTARRPGEHTLKVGRQTDEQLIRH